MLLFYFIPYSKFNISRKKRKIPHPISVPFQITTPCEQWTELKVTSFLLPIFHHCQVFPQVICLMNKAWSNFPSKAKLKVNNFLILKPLAHSGEHTNLQIHQMKSPILSLAIPKEILLQSLQPVCHPYWHSE